MTQIKGLIFDADGVIINTPQDEIWREALKSHGVSNFTTEEYNKLASGISRDQAVKNIFKHFGIRCTKAKMDTLYKKKQEVTDEYINKNRISLYGSTLRFILAARHLGLKVAVASSSKNAGKILNKSMIKEYVIYHEDKTVSHLFEHIISGTVQPGKPSPDIFLKAAKKINLSPDKCIVFEDAVAGVQAAKKGGFYCVGIDRTGIKKEMKAAKADFIVDDLRYLPWEYLLEDCKSDTVPKESLLQIERIVCSY